MDTIPPDKQSNGFIVCKNQLKNIINKSFNNQLGSDFMSLDHNIFSKIFNDAIIRTNKIVFHTYNFIKLYLLHLYINFPEKHFPLIDENFVHIVMGVVSNRTEKRGRKKSADKLTLINKITLFFNQHYKSITGEGDLVDDGKLSYILKNYECVDIVKNINNNIKEHFIQHYKKFVKIFFNFDKDLKDTYENTNLTAKDKKDRAKLIYGDINKIQCDFVSVNEEFKSDKKYHEDIKYIKTKMLPKKEYLKNSIYYDVEANPQQYLKYMIRLNRAIQKFNIKRKTEHKLFNIIPLRTSISPKYITIDTCTLISLFMENKPGYYYKNVYDNAPHIWSHLFNLKDKCFKRNGYEFNNMIKTDGVGCSIVLKKSTSNDVKHSEHEIIFDSEEFINDVIEIKNKTKGKFVKGFFKNKAKVIIPTNPYKYIEETKLTGKKIVTIDPGHTDLITCYSEAAESVKEEFMEDEIENLKSFSKFRYTRAQRNRESKTIRYRKILETIKTPQIVELETKLSEYNSKTCMFDEFRSYLIKKIETNRKLYKHYEQTIFRKLKINRYINYKKSESKMVNEFKKKFGIPGEVLIVFGDYDKIETMRGSEPHISKLLKKLFKQHGYEVCLINEFNTSKLCNKCCSENERWTVKDKNSKDKLSWKLLRCKSETCLTFHDRDLNATRNMLKIVKKIMNGEKRPEEYIRKTPLNENFHKTPLGGNCG